MKKPVDNPPAFPLTVPTEFQFANEGMSLRDWFAGQALAGMLTSPANDAMPATEFVTAAFTIADAMLVERGRRA